MTTRLLPDGTVTVRNAEEADLPSIQVIYAHHVHHGVATFEEVPPSVDELRLRRTAVIASDQPYLVAEVEGQVVGYAYASAWKSRPAYRYTVEDSVYVAAGHVRRGIGSALLSALIAHCEAGPWRQMLAVIADTDSPASTALHSRFGFARVGTLSAVGFKHGRWVDTVLMQRSLGSGSGQQPV